MAETTACPHCAVMHGALTHVQNRCNTLLEEARDARARLRDSQEGELVWRSLAEARMAEIVRLRAQIRKYEVPL